jgi:hypothetical protein
MIINDSIKLAPVSQKPRSQKLRLTINDVTGNFTVQDEEVDENVTAGMLAQTVARRFEFPSETVYALRDQRGAYLDDKPLKDLKQVGDEPLTLTPKTHLGGRL